MTDIVKQFEILEKRIVEAQEKLRQKEPNHPLLRLVEVDDMGIYYTAECGGRYEGMTKFDGLSKYANELEEVSSEQDK